MCKRRAEIFTATPTPGATGEKKANSGVYLQQYYEIQILDSYGTPKDQLKKGDCGAVYRQKAPDVNACLPPEQWQTYDIDLKSARFDDQHNKLSKAVVSVVQMVKRAEYKRRQAPPGGTVRNRAFGRDWRYPITSGY